MTVTGAPERAEVVVVGGGPAGAATAAWCARFGLDVVVLDRARFPRDKVCGDGLTPRAVGELEQLGVQTTGWQRVDGLRLVSGDFRVDVPWPLTARSADHGLVRRRTDLDDAVLAHARDLGARVHEGWDARRLVHDAAGTVVGVEATRVDEHGRRTAQQRRWNATAVVEATGVSARLAVAEGRERSARRPLGVAVRGYRREIGNVAAQQDRGGTVTGRWMESHLQLWAGAPERSTRLPGYGWVFPTGDGHVNVGLGTVHSSPARQAATHVRHREVLSSWLAGIGGGRGLDGVEGIRAAALPMAFNRGPLSADGLLLVGDAAGMVSPFNGEGIAYALMAGRVAGHVLALAARQRSVRARERELARYGEAMHAEVGGYFTLGRAFVALIEHPEVMRWCTRHGVRSRLLLPAVVRLLADSYEPRGGDLVDRTIAALAALAPQA